MASITKSIRCYYLTGFDRHIRRRNDSDTDIYVVAKYTDGATVDMSGTPDDWKMAMDIIDYMGTVLTDSREGVMVTDTLGLFKFTMTATQNNMFNPKGGVYYLKVKFDPAGTATPVWTSAAINELTLEILPN